MPNDMTPMSLALFPDVYRRSQSVPPPVSVQYEADTPVTTDPVAVADTCRVSADGVMERLSPGAASGQNDMVADRFTVLLAASMNGYALHDHPDGGVGMFNAPVTPEALLFGKT